MARIPMTSGFTLIPEGEHIFRIFGVEYKEDFGNLTVHLINAQGMVHKETFHLKNGNKPNEGAMNAFSYFAKTAMNDYSMEDIDPDDLVGCYICCEVVHNTQPSNKDPKKTVTFCNLGNKSVADGFDTTPVPLALTKTLEPSEKPKGKSGKAKPAAPAQAAPAASGDAPAASAPETPSGGLDLDDLLR